ncbi:14319_t:CDS:1, partial [Funneliformis mosseae]
MFLACYYYTNKTIFRYEYFFFQLSVLAIIISHMGFEDVYANPSSLLLI